MLVRATEVSTSSLTCSPSGCDVYNLNHKLEVISRNELTPQLRHLKRCYSVSFADVGHSHELFGNGFASISSGLQSHFSTYMLWHGGGSVRYFTPDSAFISATCFQTLFQLQSLIMKKIGLLNITIHVSSILMRTAVVWFHWSGSSQCQKFSHKCPVLALPFWLLTCPQSLGIFGFIFIQIIIPNNRFDSASSSKGTNMRNVLCGSRHESRNEEEQSDSVLQPPAFLMSKDTSLNMPEGFYHIQLSNGCWTIIQVLCSHFDTLTSSNKSLIHVW